MQSDDEKLTPPYTETGYSQHQVLDAAQTLIT